MQNTNSVRPRLLETLSWSEQRALGKEYRAANGFAAKGLRYIAIFAFAMALVLQCCELAGYSFLENNGRSWQLFAACILLFIGSLSYLVYSIKFRKWIKNTKNIALSPKEALKSFPVKK